MKHLEALERRTLLAVNFAHTNINSVAVQADSKIVIAGAVGVPNQFGWLTDRDFVLSRFNADGSLDTTFGDGGTIREDFGGDDSAREVAIDSLGRILVAGSGGANKDFVIARYTADGDLDSSFANSGTRLVDFGADDRVLALTLTNDNKILVAGERFDIADPYSEVGVPLARLNPNGSFDAGFGTAGKNLLQLPSDPDVQVSDRLVAINALAGAADGAIVFVGDMYHGNELFAVAGSVLSDGSLDDFGSFAGFFAHGVAIAEVSTGVTAAAWVAYDTTPISSGVEVLGSALPEPSRDELYNREVKELLVQPDGKLVVVGAVSRFNSGDPPFDPGGTGFRVSRYQPGGGGGFVFDATFGDSGTTEMHFPVSNPGSRSTLVAGAELDAQSRIVVAGTTGGSLVIARYTSEGQLDPTFNGNGVVRFGSATISGRVFNDKNANGIFDRDDDGISGFRVFLDQPPFNGTLDLGEISRPVSGTGTYTFRDVPGGTYRVRVVPHEGWRQTFPALGYYEITIRGGQIARSLSFANTDRALIKGTVFMDANKNRMRDVGEAEIGGWFVYIDHNNNGILDRGDDWALTNSRGEYRFHSLAAGKYVVRVASSPNYRATAPAGGAHIVTLSPGQSISNRNFGLKRLK